MSTTTDILYGVVSADTLRSLPDGTYTLSYAGAQRGLRSHIKGKFFTRKTDAVSFKQAQAPDTLVFRFEVTTPVDGIYTVMENSDQTEGRGAMIPVASFTNFKAALEISRGRGVMGYGDGDVELVQRAENSLYETAAQFRAAQKGTSPARGSSRVTLYNGYFGGHVEYFKAMRKVG